MKKIYIAFVSFLVCLSTNSQVLSIGIVIPEETIDEVDAPAYQILFTRLEKLLTREGISSTYNKNFVIYPVVDFITDNLIEGGMRNINKVDIELTVNVVSLSNFQNFGGFTWKLEGYGIKRSDAVKDAFSKIKSNDLAFTSFLYDTKMKIEEYYLGNRMQILERAKALAIQNQYEEAFALLSEYPLGLTGYEQIQSQIATLYKQYSAENCSEILQEARAEYALKNYKAAVDILLSLDGNTPCASESKELLNQIQRQKSKDEADERAFRLKQNEIDAKREKAEQEYNLKKRAIDANVEKTRLNAAYRLASAYYNSRPRVTYNTLIVHR